jgi:hypothetical protein
MNISIYYTYFSDTQRINYEFYKLYSFYEITGIEIKCADFLYWGLTDPEPLTSGPGVHISRPCGQT